MAWSKPEFGSKSDVNRAGDALISGPGPSDDDLKIINNWRAIHACPLLTMRMTLSARAKKQDQFAIISQRTKRIQAISLKLSENRRHGLTMNLSQMQDIGGCRATLRTVAEVECLVAEYESAWKKNQNRGGTLKKKHDYIQNPKSTGYRGVHFVCKYHSESKENAIYNDLQIEVQLRSKLQHYWATAVETIDFFTGQILKSNIGQLPWQRFFVLASNEFARLEGRPLIPGAPQEKSAAVTELRTMRNQITTIAGVQAAHKVISSEASDKSDGQLYLLQLDLDARTINRTSFGKEAMKEAQEKYLQIELQIKDNPSKQAVLVSVDSMAALPAAYPNFYLDITEFNKCLNSVMR
jgi:ppGpp synthetase/RelA/SpoT-type nucleotidyltranferase